jgi:hypothetical protein
MVRGRGITHSKRLAPVLLSLLLLAPAEARTQTPGPSLSPGRAAARSRMPPILVIIEHGRISIEADIASHDTVLGEVGWPRAFVTNGAPLRIMYSGSAARLAVQRRLKDVNYVVMESKAGRGEIQYYPNDRDVQLANIAPQAREPGRPPAAMPNRQPGPFRPTRGTDPAVVAKLREQLHLAASPTEKARALDELALYAEEDVIRDTAIEMLGRETHVEILESALEALDDVRRVPIRALLDFINRERRKDLRVQAIEIIGRHAGNDVAAREVLTRISTGREDESVKRAARSALEDLTP